MGRKGNVNYMDGALPPQQPTAVEAVRPRHRTDLRALVFTDIVDSVA
jgi:hypothetical protein